MALIRQNTELDGQVTGQTPDAGGDDYLVPDGNRDKSYTIGKPIETMIAASSDPTDDFQIISGGIVSDSGSAQIDITASISIGFDADVNHKIIEIPALVNVPIPVGWNDDRQIWVVGQHKYITTGPTRTHDETSESYNYQMIDSYLGVDSTDNLFTDVDPTGARVIFGSFKMNGTIYTDQSVRSVAYSLSNNNILPPTDEWRIDGHAGYGSTDTMIPYYSNTRVDVAVDGSWNKTNNGTNGCKVDILVDGVYSVTTFRGTALGTSGPIAITLNADADTTSSVFVNSLISNRLSLSFSQASVGTEGGASVSWVGSLIAGDTIRPHSDATVPNNSFRSGFSIKRIS